MEFKVEIVSTEKIKPSSPTPSNLITFKLSLFDQLVPYPYAPITFYYLPKNFPSHDNQLQISNHLQTLKKSLSQTLTLFYPLAGTIKDDLSINCNDEGAYFKQAKVNCSLLNFLSQPNLMLSNNFFPDDFIKPSKIGDSITNIQANVFECGGIALGLCISHKIVDGSALSTFIKAWTSTAFGCSHKENIIYPNFDSAHSLFPAKDLSIKNASSIMWGSFRRKGNGVLKRFVFDACALSTLKAQASSLYVQNPTRVEAVSALIWKAKLVTSKETNGKPRPCLLTHNVNLRRRMDPPLPKDCIGNMFWLASAKYNLDENSNEGLSGLVNNLRDGFRKFDSEFVKNMGKGEKGYSLTLMLKSIKEISEYASKDEVDYLGMNSWCNFGFYEADFGWGKPIWVSFCGGSEESEIYCPYVTFIDTKYGDGIEAWINMEEEEMTMLESNPEIIKYVSVDPSPLVYKGNKLQIHDR